MRSVRRVRRVLRKIDPWTVFKFAIVFNAIAGLIFVLGAWVMWSIALQRDIPGGIADIFESLTLSFTPDGPLYFRALLLLTIVWWVVATAAMTLGSVVYNLISDLVGGVEYDVLEESLQPQKRRRLLPAAPARPVPNGGTRSTPSSNGPTQRPAPAKERVAPHSQLTSAEAGDGATAVTQAAPSAKN